MKEKKKPEIGIFYLLNGRIVSETAPVADVKPSGGIRAYPRQHYELWSELQNGNPDLADLDCYALPRGRVIYNENVRKFQILADKHIFERDALVDFVIGDFGLDRSNVQLREDDHYQCAVCKSKLSQL
jgi:hypothetical protein